MTAADDSPETALNAEHSTSKSEDRNPLRRVGGLLIDLDGVVYVGNQPIPGATDFFAWLRRRGLPFLVITNNSSLTPEQYVEKLRGMGISVEERELLTSAEATGAYLASIAPAGARIFLIGEQGLRTAHERRGFALVEQQPEFVVVGIDRAFDYRKLTLAIRAVKAGARLVGANPDLTLPTEEGESPGAGALLAAISAATGVTPIVVGKPERAMLALAAQRLGLEPAEVGVVGDRLDTDILGARRAGMISVLVLTGITRREALATCPYQPHVVVENLPELARMLSGSKLP